MNTPKLIAALIIAYHGFCSVAISTEAVSFNRDVRPLLAGKCYACHGPDEETREAGLRLDDRQEAIDFGALEPGDANGSELVARIMSDDPDIRMPPPKAGAPLNDAEIDLLRRWVDEGAAYTKHWAFVPPKKAPLPKVSQTDWIENPIDAFVLKRLDDEGLQPSPDADPMRLVRRLYLDLIGIPPTPEQADMFVHSDDPMAYEKLVDELLQSPHYGQRWATPWLDLVRYADTNGYEKDRPRSIWPYRDWVIKALNSDIPYDQFTIEQMAGDMLPDPTLQQQIATGMHRNTMLNEEGGIDPLEYRFYAMVDRVATTGVIWMGLSTGCAQCHTHKYDPITHTDYYRLLAMMNNADEPDLILENDAVHERRSKLNAQIEKLHSELINKFPAAELPSESKAESESAAEDTTQTETAQSNESDSKEVSTDKPEAKPEPTLEQRLANLEHHEEQWITRKQAELVDWQTIVPSNMKTNLPRLEILHDGSIFATGDVTKRDLYELKFHVDQPTTISAVRLEALPDERLPARGPGMAYYEGRKGDFFLSEFDVIGDGQSITMRSGYASYAKLSIGAGGAKAENVFDGNGSTGWSAAGGEGQSHELVLNFDQPVTVSSTLECKLLFERHFVASLGRFRISIANRPNDAFANDFDPSTIAVLKRERETWTEDERAEVRSAFLKRTPLLAEARKPIDALRKQLADHPTTLVLRERPADNPRVTYRHHRGEYLSPREEVPAALPSLFSGVDNEGEGTYKVEDRLEFARWLVSDANPLVGRVTVNRAWRAFFGAGLVRTSGDFGTQSDPPTHPDLIDWLAVEFTQGGEFVKKPWSMKHLHRLIVTSHTYRQSAVTTKKMLERDRDNRLLARGPRFRVDAEMVRDMMLSASGLLSDKMFGPSVYPPQPDSVTALSYGATKWNASKGPDRYRRSLYTFRKRTAPFASLAVFDGPTGENCLARRDRSNTPLQALTLMNDAMYLEMAIALANDAVQSTTSEEEIGPKVEGNSDALATTIFRRVLTRPPTDQELQMLVAFQQQQLERLRADELNADTLVNASMNGKPEADVAASWTLVARAIMNLDEAIAK